MKTETQNAMREIQEYYDLRNHALDFLERYFSPG
jgi:nitrate/nitrite transport system ATP-binding protein